MPQKTLTKGFNLTEAIIAKTMEYLSVPSVLGYEKQFTAHLEQDFNMLGLEVTRHPGLLEVKGNDPLQAIICAHIDRHGLISIGNDEYAYAAQYVREIKYGEPHQSSRKELLSIADRFEGERIYAYDPKTGLKMGEGTIKPSQKAMENGDSVFFVDGIDEYESGIPLAYARTAEAANGHLKGQIDNTISIGVIHALFKNGFQGTAYLTCEEEVGKSWVHISNHLEREKIETQDLLIIDTSPYLSEAPIEQGKVIFRNRDRFAEFNINLTKNLVERAETLELPCSVKDEVFLEMGKTIDDLGSTELGRLTLEKKRRWGGTTVQIPTNMYHTSYETTSYIAVKHYYTFLKDILIKDPISFDIKRA